MASAAACSSGIFQNSCTETPAIRFRTPPGTDANVIITQCDRESKVYQTGNYTIYSDKLRLSVLDLTHINLATEEDRQYQIDYWASLFKATTWEELKMLAEKNESLAEATETLYKLSQEEMIRLQCEAREDYYRRERSIQRQMRELTTTNKELTLEKQRPTEENEQLADEIARLRAQLDSI